MNRILIGFVMTLSFAASGQIQAQVSAGPGGSLTYPNGDGRYTTVLPGRLNPGAEVIVPGTARAVPGGYIYQGADGQVHGSFTEPGGSILLADHDGGKQQSLSKAGKGVPTVTSGTSPSKTGKGVSTVTSGKSAPVPQRRAIIPWRQRR